MRNPGPIMNALAKGLSFSSGDGEIGIGKWKVMEYELPKINGKAFLEATTAATTATTNREYNCLQRRRENKLLQLISQFTRLPFH